MKAQLVLTIADDGKMSVTGPINDKILSYGMLALAFDIIKDTNDKAAASRILTPPPGLKLD